MKLRYLFASTGLIALAWGTPAAAQNSAAEEAYDTCLETLFSDDPEQRTVLCQPPPRSGSILVSASRDQGIRIDRYNGSATLITASDIEQRQVRDIADVLRDVPGVAVSSIAGQTQLRLRGSEANHVLVLIDGIEVSNPFSGEFDAGTLQAELGSRVEVLRGAQSALYGSDAIGGVIAYESASGAELRGVSARIEGGTDNTINAAARAGLGDFARNLALSATLVSSDGQPNARGGSRDIGRDSYTLSAKGEIRLADNLTLRATGRYIRTEGQFNDTDPDPTSATFGQVIDTPGNEFENDAFYALAGARLATFDDAWTHDLSIQIADIARDTFGPAGRTSGSDGDRLKASYVSAARLGRGDQSHFVTFAADWERERFRNDDPFDFAFTGRRRIENVGLAGEYRFEGRFFDVSAALRHDINTRFADETTYRLGAGVDIAGDTRLRGAYGTGIKNPGFFELFGFFDGEFIGNEDLTPEKSESWEIGLDQGFAGGAVTLSATYFESELEGEIFTTFPPPTFIATPANRESDSDRQGVELSARAQIGPRLTLDAAYSWLDATEDGAEEVRRPGNIASAILTWTAPNDAASATLIIRHNGASDDAAFTDPSFIPVRVRLDDFTLVNLAAEARLTDRISLFGRVENLLDEEYEQVFSFTNRGISAVVGARLAL